ncbi:hypothetical protein BSKO_00224 [Bryopsis sp. KO-2023]|nr:hypothetical protein BSKO_00224 [Bryopsis sp. KO-2023]
MACKRILSLWTGLSFTRFATSSSSKPPPKAKKVRKSSKVKAGKMALVENNAPDLAAVNQQTKKRKSAPAPEQLTLRVKRLSENATIPQRGSSRAAGYDLSSAEDCSVPARGKTLIKTDLSVAIPPGTYGRVAPRSGLALKKFIDVGAGVIDEDYRGPLGVILFNFSDTEFEVKTGDRIAQLILERIYTPDVEEVEELDDTERGTGGFGSTGVAKETQPAAK